MNDIEFPKGIKAYKPSEKAPDFIKANIVIEAGEAAAWLSDRSSGDKVRLDLRESQGGNFYLCVNNWKTNNGHASDGGQTPQEPPPFEDGDCPF